MKNLTYISIFAFLIFLFFFCNNKESPPSLEVDKEKLSQAIKNLYILSKIDTAKIEFVDDSLLKKINFVEKYKPYLKNMSIDTLFGIKDYIELYRKVEKRFQESNPKKSGANNDN